MEVRPPAPGRAAPGPPAGPAFKLNSDLEVGHGAFRTSTRPGMRRGVARGPTTGGLLRVPAGRPATNLPLGRGLARIVGGLEELGIVGMK